MVSQIPSLVPRPTPLFLLKFALTDVEEQPILPHLSTQTEEQKEQGRPGNEVSKYQYVLLKIITKVADNNTVVLYFVQLTAVLEGSCAPLQSVFVPLTAVMGFGNVLVAVMRLDVVSCFH